jgi:hypothetical protein
MKTPLPIQNVRRKTLLVLAGLLVLGTSASAAAPTGSAPSFSAAKSYGTGREPHSVAIGDLNGDGKPDLATANGDASSVSVLLNRGDGSFPPQLDYATGGGPFSVAIGDLNGDRKPDLATANWQAEGTVSVLLNTGDGSFQAKLDYATGRGASSVAIGDLNGDRKPDLATANAYSGPTPTVSVLLNRGDGSFRAKLDYRTGSSPSSVAIGELNGDGEPDLAIANSGASTVSVLSNRGDGSFQAKLDYRTGAWPQSVAIGDLNGDGTPDLATANFDNFDDASTVSVLLNRGNGTFRARSDYRTGTGAWQVAIGDLDSDGKLDLATATAGPSAVSVFLNRGDGRFRPKLDYGAGRSPLSVAIGDLNSDGKPDVATANSRAHTVSALINSPGLCTVQDVKRRTLTVAKRTIPRANCRVGNLRRARSRAVRRGRVISQRPKPGTVLPAGGKVNLVVSRGRRP